MYKKQLRNKNGITLIALVITIVLLILAGVTIVTLTGDNGLLQKAAEAKQANGVASAQEKIQVEVAGSYGLDGKIDIEQLNNNLRHLNGIIYKENTLSNTNIIDKLPLDVQLDGHTFYIDENGDVQEAIWIQDKTRVINTQTGKKYDVGDIVLYNCGVTDYTGKWGILGAEKGKLLLMSTINVTKITLGGKQDYLNDGITKLNNACSIYKNITYADFARSIKVEDINKITGYIPRSPITYTYTMVDGNVKRNDRATTSSVKKFEDINGTILTENNSIEVTHNNYSYSLANYLDSGSKANNLFNANNNSYWLDYPYINANIDTADWGFRYITSNQVYRCSLWDSNNGAASTSRGVRAVVILNSSAKLSESSNEKGEYELYIN